MIQKLDIKYMNESHQGGHFSHFKLLMCNTKRQTSSQHREPIMDVKCG